MDEHAEAQQLHAQAWINMPDPIKRVASSLERYRRLQAVGAPVIIQARETELLTERIGELRTYLDVLCIELTPPND